MEDMKQEQYLCFKISFSIVVPSVVHHSKKVHYERIRGVLHTDILHYLNNC